MFYRFAVASMALMIAGAFAGAQAKIVITVDKSTQRMTVAVDGEQRWAWPVSTGRSGYSTPSGSFTAFRMEEDHRSKEWDDAPMPHSIFFTKRGHAIHGTLDQRRLGTPASHGCVRLSTANAAALFALVRSRGVTQTQVVLLGHEPASGPAMVRRQNQRERVEAEARPLMRQPYEPYRAQPSYIQPGYIQPGYIQPGYGRPDVPVYRYNRAPRWDSDWD